MKIEIKNRKTYSGPGHYVGRPSALGNPFLIGRNGTRLEVIQKYEQWLRFQMVNGGKANNLLNQMVHELKRSKKLVLICWCSPLPCHADVIKKILLEKLEHL